MKLPPGPQTPSLFQRLQFVFSPMSFMNDCTQRFGDIYTMQLNPPVVMTSNPQALQQILTNDTGDKNQFTAPSEMSTVFEPTLGKHSVITISGEAHRRQRQLMMPSFHGERMRAYTQVINQIAIEISNQWQIDKPFDLRNKMQAMTLRVMMQAVLGLYVGDRAQEVEKLIAEMMDAGGKSQWRALQLYFPILQQDLGAWSSWGKFLRRRERIDQLLYAEIAERRAQPDTDRTDILSMLMAARDEQGEAMTDVELRDEMMTLLLAGHETTATALTWALYWIHKFPQVKEKLLAELDSLGENPDSNAIMKLPYLNAVYCETLRIYPVGMLTFPRMAKSSVVLCGQELPANTTVIGSIYSLHQREDLYPQPQQFRPERFLEKQFSPYEFLPYGGGARRCIGMALAQFEMKLILVQVLQNWDLALLNNEDVSPQRRGLVTGPKRVIQMVAKGKRAVSNQLPVISYQ